MSTGYDVFLANAERSANEHKTKQLKQTEDETKNLENFIGIYVILKETPPNNFSCQIELDVESESHVNTIIVITKFLKETEKWPSNKIKVYTSGRYKITVELCITGMFRKNSD